MGPLSANVIGLIEIDGEISSSLADAIGRSGDCDCRTVTLPAQISQLKRELELEYHEVLTHVLMGS